MRKLFFAVPALLMGMQFPAAAEVDVVPQERKSRFEPMNRLRSASGIVAASIMANSHATFMLRTATWPFRAALKWR